MYELRNILALSFLLLLLGCVTYIPPACEISNNSSNILQENLDIFLGYNPENDTTRDMIYNNFRISPERKMYCEVSWDAISKSGGPVLDGYGTVRFDPKTLKIIKILPWDYYL